MGSSLKGDKKLASLTVKIEAKESIQNEVSTPVSTTDKSVHIKLYDDPITPGKKIYFSLAIQIAEDSDSEEDVLSAYSE